eukprot:4198282-Pleurochrysis_carterae.AAC.1
MPPCANSLFRRIKSAANRRDDIYPHMLCSVTYGQFNMWANLVQTSGDLPPVRGEGAHRQRRRRRLRAEGTDVVAGEHALSCLLASPRKFPSHGYIFRDTFSLPQSNFQEYGRRTIATTF